MPNSIEKIRLILKMSRRDFADAIGVTTGAISNYESAVRSPKMITAWRIVDLAKKRGVTVRLEDIYPRSE